MQPKVKNSLRPAIPRKAGPNAFQKAAAAPASRRLTKCDEMSNGKGSALRRNATAKLCADLEAADPAAKAADAAVAAAYKKCTESNWSLESQVAYLKAAQDAVKAHEAANPNDPRLKDLRQLTSDITRDVAKLEAYEQHEVSEPHEVSELLAQATAYVNGGATVTGPYTGIAPTYGYQSSNVDGMPQGVGIENFSYLTDFAAKNPGGQWSVHINDQGGVFYRYTAPGSTDYRETTVIRPSLPLAPEGTAHVVPAQPPVAPGQPPVAGPDDVPPPVVGPQFGVNPPTSPEAAAALAWAYAQMNRDTATGVNSNNGKSYQKDPTAWNDWCLAFVSTAYGRDSKLLAAPRAIDAYENFKNAGRIVTEGNPPAGAPVFFGATKSNGGNGHIVVATGRTTPDGDPIFISSGWPGRNGIFEITKSELAALGDPYLGYGT